MNRERAIWWQGAVFSAGFVFMTQAHAVATFFTDEPTFQTAVAGNLLALESFESAFTDAPSVAFTGFSATVGGGVPNVLSCPGVVCGTAATSDGLRAIGIIDFGFGGTAINFTFDTPINAFGVDMFGALNFGGGGTVTLSNDIGDSGIVLSGLFGPSDLAFIGFANNTASFSSVTVTSSLVGEGIQFDRLQFGVFGGSVPEPTTLALLGLSLAGLGIARRQQH